MNKTISLDIKPSSRFLLHFNTRIVPSQDIFEQEPKIVIELGKILEIIISISTAEFISAELQKAIIRAKSYLQTEGKNGRLQHDQRISNSDWVQP